MYVLRMAAAVGEFQKRCAQGGVDRNISEQCDEQEAPAFFFRLGGMPEHAEQAHVNKTQLSSGNSRTYAQTYRCIIPIRHAALHLRRSAGAIGVGSGGIIFCT